MDGLFPGISLDLRGADATKTVTLTVGNDVEKAKDAIEDFVAGFNELMKFIDDQVRFDPQTNRAGILLGDRQVTTVQDQVRTALTKPVAGLKTQMNRLGALGISTNEKGQLTVNQSKLDDALNGRVSGVVFDDVRRLFALTGSAAVAGIQFVTASTKTVSSTTPYQLFIAQAAQQASLTATNPLAASTVITAANNTFTMTVDSAVSGTITLAPGTYSRSPLPRKCRPRLTRTPASRGARSRWAWPATGSP